MKKFSTTDQQNNTTHLNQFEFPNLEADYNPDLILGPAGESFEFIKTGKSTHGKYLISKTIVPPGAGPCPHIHQDTDEWFYAPHGGIVFFMGEKSYPDVSIVPGVNAEKEVLHATTMEAGELIFVPQHYMHAFINNTDKPQLLYLIWTPDTDDVSILNYFKQVGQVMDDLENPPPIEPLSKIRFVSDAPHFGINQSHDFWQYVQRVEYSPLKKDNHAKALLRLLQEKECCTATTAS